jgi:hypothetical protein
MTADDSLAAIRLKIGRASDHLRDLQCEMEARRAAMPLYICSEGII